MKLNTHGSPIAGGLYSLLQVVLHCFRKLTKLLQIYYYCLRCIISIPNAYSPQPTHTCFKDSFRLDTCSFRSKMSSWSHFGQGLNTEKITITKLLQTPFQALQGANYSLLALSVSVRAHWPHGYSVDIQFFLCASVTTSYCTIVDWYIIMKSRPK